MTGLVDDMRWCPWEAQTLPVGHDCIAGTHMTCEGRRWDGQVCGACLTSLAAQADHITRWGTPSDLPDTPERC